VIAAVAEAKNEELHVDREVLDANCPARATGTPA